jgi:hypothetical protein
VAQATLPARAKSKGSALVRTRMKIYESNSICKQGEQKHDQAHQHACSAALFLTPSRFSEIGPQLPARYLQAKPLVDRISCWIFRLLSSHGSPVPLLLALFHSRTPNGGILEIGTVPSLIRSFFVAASLGRVCFLHCLPNQQQLLRVTVLDSERGQLQQQQQRSRTKPSIHHQ